MEIKPIGKIINDYESKFAVPRQSCLENDLLSRIEFFDEFSNPVAFEGIEGFSHLWLIWEFDKNTQQSNSLAVRPPRLGGNTRQGVFATRSPYRPNPIGLSSVKLVKVENVNNKVSLIVSGADLVSGTPIYDIKPYLSYSDCHNDAKNGFADLVKDYSLNVEISDKILETVPSDKQKSLINILSQDPRPSYHNDGRIYGFKFAGMEIKFTVTDDILKVLEICYE